MTHPQQQPYGHQQSPQQQQPQDPRHLPPEGGTPQPPPAKKKTKVSDFIVGAIVLIVLCGAGAWLATTFLGDNNTREITRAEIENDGLVWPFTVDAGELACEDDGAITFTADGMTYGLTGLATSNDAAAVDPIWADDPEVEDAKLSLTDVTSLGQELC